MPVGTVKPLADFRPRQGRCKPCQNAYMRRYRKTRRAKMVRQSMGRFLIEVCRTDSLHCVEAVVACMTARFGGVEGFCRAWGEDMGAAKPGSRARLDSYRAIIHIAELLEPAQPSNDVSRLTDAELDAEIDGLLTAKLESEGWTRPEGFG